MPPHLPLLAISRSQSLRIGRGPGGATVPPFNMGDTVTNPANGQLYTVMYADLGSPQARRDIQHHSAEGAIETVAGAASLNVWSDLYRLSSSGLVVSAGTGFGLNVSSQGSGAAPQIASRFYGPIANVAVTGTGSNVVTIPTPNPTFDRTDQVYVTPAGTLGYLTGALASVAATYQVMTIATTGVPTGGTFTLGFQYNGYTYVTGTIAFNATAAAVAAAILAATGNVSAGLPQQMTLPAGTLAGAGGPLTTATVTLTASGALVGPIQNMTVINNGLTGGTTPGVTIATTTVGSGGSAAPIPAGINLPLANVWVPAGAASAAACTITNIVLTS